MENVMDRETGYIEDACACVIGSYTQQRIDDDNCPIHGYNSSEDDRLEAAQAMREFAATLPVLNECGYVDLADGRVRCEFRTRVAGYEGIGSDEAAAYGRMIQQLVEREA